MHRKKSELDVGGFMKRILPLLIIVFGFMVIFAGFLYDVLFAGIPYQDPTPALAAKYLFHSNIASIIRWSGLGIVFLGGLTGVIVWLVKRIRK